MCLRGLQIRMVRTCVWRVGCRCGRRNKGNKMTDAFARRLLSSLISNTNFANCIGMHVHCYSPRLCRSRGIGQHPNVIDRDRPVTTSQYTNWVAFLALTIVDYFAIRAMVQRVSRWWSDYFAIRAVRAIVQRVSRWWSDYFAICAMV